MEIEVFVSRLNLRSFNQRAWGAPGSLPRHKIFVMRHKRKIKITVTRRELLYTLSERRRVSRTAWCTECGGDFSVLTPGLAAEFLSVSTREIYRMVEAGRLHYVEAPDQELFICSVFWKTLRKAQRCFNCFTSKPLCCAYSADRLKIKLLIHGSPPPVREQSRNRRMSGWISYCLIFPCRVG